MKYFFVLTMIVIFTACTNAAKDEKIAVKAAVAEEKKAIPIEEKKISYSNLEKGMEQLSEKMIVSNKFSNKTIAVGGMAGDKGETTELSATASEYLEKNLIKYSDNRYKIADRANIKSILDEWKLSEAGMIDEEYSVQTGKLLGIDIFIFSKYRMIDDNMMISVKAVDIKTGETLVLETENVSLTEKETENAKIEIKEKIVEKTKNTIQLWTEKKAYKIGEKAKIYFKAKEDCYITLIDISPAGDVTVIYPNAYSDGNFIRGGEKYQIPSENAGFEIEVTEPMGTEIIRAIATKEPIADFKNFMGSYNKDNPFGAVKGSFTELSRGLNIAAKNAAEGTWSDTVIKFQIE